MATYEIEMADQDRTMAEMQGTNPLYLPYDESDLF